MSPRRAPAQPPTIPGYTYVSVLGSGGFADVFLYEQHRPRRKVAVKVLLETMLSASVLRQFDAEADLMAQLSTHPAIVTIYEVGRTDDGRPYLAMQYCPRPNLGQRYRKEPLGLADALRVGVEIAGAVETAHRADILHRDIKPANILVTEYDEPLLTDFGIASALDHGDQESEGLSIPWSPPESFADPPRASVATDVWALGATVYSLLTGRSPFELPGRSNSGADLIARIEAAKLPPIGRLDVPDTLERVLGTAMGRLPESRYPSALAFARALQQVQAELGMGTTPVSVLDDVVLSEPEELDDDDPGTRIRRIVSIDPTAPPRAAPPVAAAPARPSPSPAPVVEDTYRRPAPAPAPEGPWNRAPALPVVEETVQRVAEAAEDPVEAPDEAIPARRGRGILIGSLAAVLVLGGGAAAVLGRGTPAPVVVEQSAAPQDLVVDVVPTPADLVGVPGADGVVFTWTNPDPKPGDLYLWRVLDVLDESRPSSTPDASVTVPADPSGRTCIEVSITRSGKTSATAAKACAP